MKKIVAILLVPAILLGACAYAFVCSPEYMLHALVQEMERDGFAAVESHLTPELQQVYQRLMALAGQSWLSGLTGKDSAGALIAMIRSGSSLTWKLADIRRSPSSASALLDVESAAFDAQISLEMQRLNGEWLISSFTLPSFALK